MIGRNFFLFACFERAIHAISVFDFLRYMYVCVCIYIYACMYIAFFVGGGGKGVLPDGAGAS